MNDWHLAARLARRELRGGLRGFGVFLACLALGVASIAGVGSLAQAIVDGLHREGRAILGGDAEFRLVQRAADPAELTYLQGLGAMSHTVDLRAMAYAVAGEDRTIVDLKAVDDHYPLVGEISLDTGDKLAATLALKDGRYGMVAEAILADRLHLSRGDHVRLGSMEVEFRGTLLSEPDRLSVGMNIGPRVMISEMALPQTGLTALGSLANHSYRLVLANVGDIAKIREESNQRFPQAGWRLRDASEAAPQVKTFVDRMALFLVLVGLTALTVGGVGVSNAVKGYLDGKMRIIATLKCLGAPGGLIFQIYLIQIMALALLGILIGLIIGAGLPFLAISLLADQLPFPAQASVAPVALALAAIYGFLTALVFTIWPLARARDVPPQALFRDLFAPISAWPRKRYMLATALAAGLLCALAVVQAEDRNLAIGFLVGAGLVFGVLRLAAIGLMASIKRLARPRNTLFRIAFANLHRIGGQTPVIVLSLGLGLTLLVTIGTIEGNLAHEVRDNVSGRAPSFFFVDIQNDQLPAFQALAKSLGTPDGFTTTPNLRGRITKLGDVPADQAVIDPEARWALKGDRGITYTKSPPKNAKVIEGAFWPEDYQGPPLISFDIDLARQLHLKLGDQISVNVMGRDFTATISNLRKIDWGAAGINFFMVFSPGLFERAPHTHLATLRVPPGTEDSAYRQITDAYPNISVIRVKEAIETVNGILQRLKSALLAASSVTILSGILVLSGAMAAGQRRRIYEAVVLKVLGMTRVQILAAYLLEYAALGLISAVLACAAGSLAGYVVITRVMGGNFTFDLVGAVQIAVISMVLTIGLGLIGTLAALSAKAAPYLRVP